MDFPDLVPKVELEVRDGHGRRCHIFRGGTTSLVPREEATRSLVSSLNSLANTEGLSTHLGFAGIYFEMESISALRQNLDRLFEQSSAPGSNLIRFGQCHGEVETAMCVSFESKWKNLILSKQSFKFTPTLAEALGRSASLQWLEFDHVTFDKAEMERLALALCDNPSVQALVLGHCFDGDESMVALAKHLPRMSHLHSLSLKGNKFGQVGKRALIEFLEQQGVHSIHKLSLAGKPANLQNYIDFLLWLKKNGSRPAISSSSRMKWIQLLAHFKKEDEDPSALYFTLRSDPGRFENL